LEPKKSRRLNWLIAVAFFMEQLDGTILVTAAPQIAADVGVPSADVNVTMTAYLVAVACAIPPGGWLVSRFGARPVFLVSTLAFVAASVLCALSGDLVSLTLARVLQGAAGGMMVPVGRLIVLRGATKPELVRAIALITWPALLAPVLAPALGGLITTVATWHWIFLINVPIGLAVLGFGLVMVQDTATDARALDGFGLALITVTVLALMTAVELSALEIWAGAGAAFAGALVFGVATVLWLLRARHPLLDLRVFRVRTFRVTNSGGFVFRMAVSAVPFLLPLLFQDEFGWAPLESGLIVTALFVGNIGAKPASAWLLRRWGFRTVIIGSVVGSLLTLIGFARLTAEVPLSLILTLSVVSGAFRSIGFTAYNTMQFADLAPVDLSSGNSLSATLAQLAAALGIAVGATVLRLGSTVSVEAGYRGAFLVLAALLVLSVVSALRLAPDAGGEVSGRR
jgi:EmrB/QacA subfamily drug resistance transporter